MLRSVLLLAAIAGAAAFALERVGRARVRAELAPFGREDANTLASQLTATEAITAGARSLAGLPAYFN